ncbi:hypothetical protein PTSG_04608 [Salpingoeca rosetta]|uniref:RecA family profile 1 domain-containing protein n=1 Tax=Salpingoeca rosetta (strain ATCC 50818 / BSB-021) TaxID=946362 RepID=F2U7X4_SALR5|nr:uncharacterized protein PTSG_04608 [Salpingoeca rosetta]EGD72879.1 hypothetical protein PTSG_04608 [Salpingoeca rosetta]|eukprot:XP_004994701.1 hypothetical protein PTSG_04608 [Salpingoeca rosetta]
MRLVPDLVPALTSSVLDALKRANLFTVNQFLFCGDAQVVADTELPITTVVLLREQLLQLDAYRIQVRSARSSLAREEKHSVSTGVHTIDDLLGGRGLPAGKITQLFGRSSTGKTQVCLTAAASAACEGHQVVIFDSNSSYAAERLRDIIEHKADASHQAVDVKSACERIRVVAVRDPWQLIDGLHHLLSMLSPPSSSLSSSLSSSQPPLLPSPAALHHSASSTSTLIVIDSIGNTFSPYISSTANGHALLASVGDILRRIMQTTHAACLVTNYLVHSGAHPDGKPALGSAWERTPFINIKVARADPSSLLTTLEVLPACPSRIEAQVGVGFSAQVGLGPTGVVDLST